MTSIHTPAPLAPGRLEQFSTRIAFFIAGFSLAAWAPLVPYAKARIGLDDGPSACCSCAWASARSSPCRWPVRWRRGSAAGAY
jgi:hypothetical protein